MTVPTAPMTATTGTVSVRLEELPLQLYAGFREHFDELNREFALLSLQQADPAGEVPELPQRLLDLVAALTSRYASALDAVAQQRENAVARGESSATLVYEVPPSAADGAAALAALLDEADEYCRKGDVLLTLETPPELVAFRRWYLGQFVQQIDGAAPQSWPSFAAAG